MFIDQVTLSVEAGKGGDGLSSWRREKFVARGGPDGGNGGRGGSVLLEVDHNLNTLNHLRNQPRVRAADGERGKRKRQAGKNALDTIIKVPLGTSVWVGQDMLADLTQDKQVAVAAKGGRGGYGNAHFTSSVRRAPELSELGEPGETQEMRLELKLIADVGLVGMPNAGKSTLLSVISNAKPEVADYPFTTTSPNLGVVEIDEQSFLVADIPGLIAGASTGKGLGDEFLRHIERTAILLHLIDITESDVVRSYKVINKELADYQVDLSDRPQLIVLTKIDAVSADRIKEAQAALKAATGQKVVAISSVAHKHVTDLLRQTWQMLKTTRSKAAESEAGAKEEVPVLTLADDPTAWWIEKERSKFVIKGQKIEGFGKRTNFEQTESRSRLLDIMKRLGITRELLRLGIKNGDVVSIGGREFKW